MRFRTIRDNSFPALRQNTMLIHKDFRYAAHAALTGFQQSMFKEYLEVELAAFKAAVGTFAKAQTERLSELQAYVHSLFARVHAQHAQRPQGFQASHRRF